MAFIDDARDTGREIYTSRDTHRPRHEFPRPYYTWAAIATSLGLWAVMALVVLQQC
jgi:hypothetical protein